MNRALPILPKIAIQTVITTVLRCLLPMDAPGGRDDLAVGHPCRRRMSDPVVGLTLAVAPAPEMIGFVVGVRPKAAMT